MTRKQWNLEQLELIRDFCKDANWGGYGEPPILSSLIDRAKSVLDWLPIQPEVFMSNAGEIQFEYEKDNGEYLEFRLLPNDEAFYMFSLDIKGNEMESIIETIEEANRLVVEFHNDRKEASE